MVGPNGNQSQITPQVKRKFKITFKKYHILFNVYLLYDKTNFLFLMDKISVSYGGE